MKFQVDFNRPTFNDDKFLIDILGAKVVKTGSDKYPPFELLYLELDNFEQLEKIITKVDTHYGDYYSAVISFDPPTIYLDNKI